MQPQVRTRGAAVRTDSGSELFVDPTARDRGLRQGHGSTWCTSDCHPKSGAWCHRRHRSLRAVPTSAQVGAVPMSAERVKPARTPAMPGGSAVRPGRPFERVTGPRQPPVLLRRWRSAPRVRCPPAAGAPRRPRGPSSGSSVRPCTKMKGRNSTCAGEGTPTTRSASSAGCPRAAFCTWVPYFCRIASCGSAFCTVCSAGQADLLRGLRPQGRRDRGGGYFGSCANSAGWASTIASAGRGLRLADLHLPAVLDQRRHRGHHDRQERGRRPRR